MQGTYEDADIETRLMNKGGDGEGAHNISGESGIDAYTLPCVK